MVLSCLNSESVILQYSKLAGSRIKIFTTGEFNNYHDDNLHLTKVYTAQNSQNLLTWEWEELPGYRRWLGQLEGQRASYANCGEPFTLERAFRQPTTEIVITQEDYQPILYFAPIKSPDYQNGIGSPIYQSGNQFLGKVPDCGNHIGFKTLSLNVSNVTPYPGSNGRWIFRVFENGLEIDSRSIWGYMNEPPTHLVEILENESFTTESKDFTKQPNTEALELVPIPNKENEWQVLRVFLDESQNPLNSTIIYSFQGKDPELFCLGLDECPENTCTVDCGTHYCCYPSTGIAVHSFPKT